MVALTKRPPIQYTSIVSSTCNTIVLNALLFHCARRRLWQRLVEHKGFKISHFLHSLVPGCSRSEMATDSLPLVLALLKTDLPLLHSLQHFLTGILLNYKKEVKN